MRYNAVTYQRIISILESKIASAKAECKVNGKVVSSAELMFAILPASEIL